MQRADRLVWQVSAILLLGALIGMAAGLLSLLLTMVESLALGFHESPSIPGPFHVAPWRRCLSVLLGLTLASLVWWFLRNRSPRVPSVKQAVDGQGMPCWQTLLHVVTQIVIVGCGASIGREVAPRELGAMLGQRFSGLFKLADQDRRLIVAISAAAGLAGVYNAPLAGLFFALEILLVDITIETVLMALGTSSVAAFTASLIRGDQVFYQLPHLQAHATPSIMVFALLGGVVCGVCGTLFRCGSNWAEAHKPTQGSAMLWQMPLAGLVTGLVAIWLPQVMGNGRAAAQPAFSAGTAGQALSSLLLMLLLVAVAKGLVTLLTIRSGASGGVLQPGIALGATVGAIMGLGWIAAFPQDSLAACALIGACALLAASQQAPLMAMCLVMELTGSGMSLVVPVGLAVAMSALVSKRLLHWQQVRLSRN
ncbi:chloride channel protein [Bifidobacterium aemilianum]|uniref:Chloride channel protein n=1 Tax=Bifidobacterium aemilianum TaxID=2493120 RepID=A0A366KAM0_9BIFI|nr:chloride channel protein [Bifidobacterium aemilianum]